MTFLIAIVLLGCVAVLISGIWKIWPDRSGGSSSYKAKQLLSANEKEFYGRLFEALPECRVLTQVALGALLQPGVKNNNRQYYRVRASFSQKIADYVICDGQMNVLAVVELDD